MASKHAQLQIFIQANTYYRGEKWKIRQELSHFVSSHFVEVLYKTITFPRRQLLNGPESSLPIQVNSTYNIFTLSKNSFKTINSCFATCFFLRIIFLHKKYIMKWFFKENIWRDDNKKMFLWKLFLVSPEL